MSALFHGELQGMNKTCQGSLTQTEDAFLNNRSPTSMDVSGTRVMSIDHAPPAVEDIVIEELDQNDPLDAPRFTKLKDSKGRKVNGIGMADEHIDPPINIRIKKKP